MQGPMLEISTPEEILSSVACKAIESDCNHKLNQVIFTTYIKSRLKVLTYPATCIAAAFGCAGDSRSWGRKLRRV